MAFTRSLVGFPITSGNNSGLLIRESQECIITLLKTVLTDEVVGIGNCTVADVDKPRSQPPRVHSSNYVVHTLKAPL